MNQFRVVLQSAEKNFKNLEGFTEPLGQKGTDITTSLLKAVDGLDRMATELREAGLEHKAVGNPPSRHEGKGLYCAWAYSNTIILFLMFKIAYLAIF